MTLTRVNDFDFNQKTGWNICFILYTLNQTKSEWVVLTKHSKFQISVTTQLPFFSKNNNNNNNKNSTTTYSTTTHRSNYFKLFIYQ